VDSLGTDAARSASLARARSAALFFSAIRRSERALCVSAREWGPLADKEDADEEALEEPVDAAEADSDLVAPGRGDLGSPAIAIAHPGEGRL
jgi:hypothetical protein